jgi:hypothetical protein
MFAMMVRCWSWRCRDDPTLADTMGMHGIESMAQARERLLFRQHVVGTFIISRRAVTALRRPTECFECGATSA